MLGISAEEFTPDDLAAQNEYVYQWSIPNNPYYFSAPFSGAVTPAAHNFIINFMLNHSTDIPGGSLTREVLKSFLSVTREPGSFVHSQGQERIPDNWHKRPTANSYTIFSTLTGASINNLMYPGIISIGGKTGTVNSFTGVNLEDLTGSVFNAATLTEGNNLACFVLQASIAGMPTQLDGLVSNVAQVLSFVTEHLDPISEGLSCPELDDFDNEIFAQFLGARAYTN